MRHARIRRPPAARAAWLSPQATCGRGHISKGPLGPLYDARMSGAWRRLAFGTTTMTLLATGRDTNDSFALIDSVAPNDTGRHVHQHEDEAFYVLEGTHEFERGDETIELGPGGFVFLPRGIPHAHRRSGEDPGRLLILITPAGFENFFVELSDARAAGRSLDAEFYADLSKKHSVTWLQP